VTSRNIMRTWLSIRMSPTTRFTSQLMSISANVNISRWPNSLTNLAVCGHLSHQIYKTVDKPDDTVTASDTEFKRFKWICMHWVEFYAAGILFCDTQPNTHIAKHWGQSDTWELSLWHTTWHTQQTPRGQSYRWNEMKVQWFKVRSKTDLKVRSKAD